MKSTDANAVASVLEEGKSPVLEWYYLRGGKERMKKFPACLKTLAHNFNAFMRLGP